jgi:hypothetical protein
MSTLEQEGEAEEGTSSAEAGHSASGKENASIHVGWTDMAPPRPRRWLPQRKAEVVAAVTSGLLSLDQALERYQLSMEEYLSWQQRIDRFGLSGLRVHGPQPRKRVRTRSVYGPQEGRPDCHPDCPGASVDPRKAT